MCRICFAFCSSIFYVYIHVAFLGKYYTGTSFNLICRKAFASRVKVRQETVCYTNNTILQEQRW